jgi:hypothetical protein
MASTGDAVTHVADVAATLHAACTALLGDRAVHTVLTAAKAIMALGSGKAAASKWFSLDDLSGLAAKRSPVDRSVTLLSLLAQQLTASAPDALAACSRDAGSCAAFRLAAERWPADASPSDLAASLAEREAAVETVAALGVPATGEWVARSRAAIGDAHIGARAAGEAFAAAHAFVAESRLHKPDALFKALASFMAALHGCSSQLLRASAAATRPAAAMAAGVRPPPPSGGRQAREGSGGSAPAASGTVTAAPAKLAALISRWNAGAGGGAGGAST